MKLSAEAQMTLHDMKLLPIPFGLAFDNYDRYVETLSGKHALHDTVGIMYQDVHNVSNITSDEPKR